jgi:phospholipase/carboxylesterase
VEPFVRHARRRIATLGLALGLVAAACAAKDRAQAPAAAFPPPLDFVEIGPAGAGDAAAPLVVAVHGLGDRPENLAALYRDISAPCRLVLPRGPIPYHGGSSWFDIDIPYAPDAALGARIGAAADRVAALIDRLKAARAIRGKPVVTGFSQGGMISFAVAVRHPEAVGLAVPIAGALPEGALPAHPTTGEKPVVRAFHGKADTLVPIDFTRRTISALTAAGYDASLEEYAGVGHTVSDDMRRDALAVIDAAIAERSDAIGDLREGRLQGLAAAPPSSPK